MNIFIDTNFYLSFYHLTSESLEELRKVLVIHKNSKAVLWITDQVIDEFDRNRETKIAEALKRFNESVVNVQCPHFIREYPEFKDLQQATIGLSTAREAVIEKLKTDISGKKLNADIAIESIFNSAQKVTVTDELLNRARRRLERGNPPGKNGSYGDAINWECLLSVVPTGEELHVISEDKDYYSAITNLYPDAPKEFLAKEYKKEKQGELYTYRRLSSFIAKKFPDAKLAVDLEKDLLVQDLLHSYSFARTHEIINDLKQYKEFTSSQVSNIADAYIWNSQVYGIVSDQDVKEFGSFIKSNFLDKLIEAQSVAFLDTISV